MEGRKNLPEWIEKFPDKFTEEGVALQAQVLAMPWEQWSQNWDDSGNFTRGGYRWRRRS
ncbi:hypothetical protein PM082_021504 [Marasmius tenuissimus]|nr:hypothetical protein PM082_021504 [Marasmius tenuissimus]